MGKIIKSGKVVVLLSGRYAGKKAIVVKSYDEGNKERRFGHALVAGIARHARRVNKAHSKKALKIRTTIQPFVKYVNFNHMMPTRYQIGNELEIREIVKDISTADKKTEVLKSLKSTLQDKYRTLPQARNLQDKNTQLRFFYNRLRF